MRNLPQLTAGYSSQPVLQMNNDSDTNRKPECTQCGICNYIELIAFPGIMNDILVELIFSTTWQSLPQAFWIWLAKVYFWCFKLFFQMNKYLMRNHNNVLIVNKTTTQSNIIQKQIKKDSNEKGWKTPSNFIIKLSVCELWKIFHAPPSIAGGKWKIHRQCSRLEAGFCHPHKHISGSSRIRQDCA